MGASLPCPRNNACPGRRGSVGGLGFFFHSNWRCGEKHSVIYMTKQKVSVFSVIWDMVRSLLVRVKCWFQFFWWSHDGGYLVLRVEWWSHALYFTEATDTEPQFSFSSSLWSIPLLAFLVMSPVFHLTSMLHFIAIKIQDPIIFQCNWGYGVQSFN